MGQEHPFGHAARARSEDAKGAVMA